MGNSSSTTEENSTTAKTREQGKLLGDEIIRTITAELDNAVQKSINKRGSEKADYEKLAADIITLQEKFTDYRKLVEDVKDQELERMSSEALQLKNSYEDYKQKLQKIIKEKEELEQNAKKKTLEQEKSISELKEKYVTTKKKLSTECDSKKSLEKELVDMKLFKTKFEVEVKKADQLQRELDKVRAEVLNEIKLKQELETKIRLGDYTTKDENAKVLRCTIVQQSEIIKRVQESLKETQRKLDKELQNKQNDSIKFAMENQLSSNLRKEKEYLLIKLQTMETQAEEEKPKIKLKLEEQEKQLKEMTEKLSAAQKTNKQQVKLKKKAQADLSVLEERNNTIKQLETKLEEKDRILMEHFKGSQQKPQEEVQELYAGELSNFLKMSEEAHTKELEMKHLELNDVKAKYESQLQQQQGRFNRIVYRLKMTEKKRDQLEQARREVQGKLNLLENSFKDIKDFSEKEMRERKEFLEEFYKTKQESEANSDKLAQASTSQDQNSLVLQALLESKTDEIALLKQQLKLKEGEIKSMVSQVDSDNKRNEMAKLHEEFMENLKTFNQK